MTAVPVGTFGLKRRRRYNVALARGLLLRCRLSGVNEVRSDGWVRPRRLVVMIAGFHFHTHRSAPISNVMNDTTDRRVWLEKQRTT